MIQSHKKNIKPQLTVASIGKLRFFVGLLLGLGYTIIFYAFCIGFRDGCLALLSAIFTGLNTEELYSFNSFIAGVAGCYGLYEMLNFCLSNQWRTVPPRKRNTILNNIRFFHYGFLLFAFRFTTLVGMIVHSGFQLPEDVKASNVINAYSYLWLLVVAVLFFQKWNDIKRFYRCKRWQYISLVVVAGFIWGLPQWDVTGYQKVIPKLKQEEQFEMSVIEDAIQRAEQCNARITPKKQLRYFYPLIKKSGYDVLWSNERGLYRSQLLLFLKVDIQLGRLDDYLTYLPLDVTRLLADELNFHMPFGRPVEEYLWMMEIIDECQRYLQAKELTEDEFHQLTYEEKYWYLKIIDFHDWKRPQFVWKDGKPDYQFIPQVIPEGAELVDLGTMDTDIDEPDYIELTPARMRQVSTQLDSLKGVVQKRLLDKNSDAVKFTPERLLHIKAQLDSLRGVR